MPAPASPPRPLLEVEGLSLAFGGVKALDGVTFAVQPGSITAQATANADASGAHDAKSAQAPPESNPVPQEPQKATRKRKLLAGF